MINFVQQYPLAVDHENYAQKSWDSITTTVFSFKMKILKQLPTKVHPGSENERAPAFVSPYEFTSMKMYVDLL